MPQASGFAISPNGMLIPMSPGRGGRGGRGRGGGRGGRGGGGDGNADPAGSAEEYVPPTCSLDESSGAAVALCEGAVVVKIMPNGEATLTDLSELHPDDLDAARSDAIFATLNEALAPTGLKVKALNPKKPREWTVSDGKSYLRRFESPCIVPPMDGRFRKALDGIGTAPAADADGTDADPDADVDADPDADADADADALRRQRAKGRVA